MKKYIKFVLLTLVLFMPLTANAKDQERIISYNSDIEVHKDASMTVIETIKVYSMGKQIRHGIYRDFPVAYSDRYGERYLVKFDLKETTRDGAGEPYHTEKSGNGVRVYIGDENTIISQGEHIYTIKYETDRQLGYFEDHDELYWNVTGSGWVFPIESATATVKLPGGITKDKISATLYTGSQNSTAQNGTSAVVDDGANFSTSKTLDSYQGLTIVVSWPKGIVDKPTAMENFWVKFISNVDYGIGILGLILVFIYYLYWWNKRGRDPKKGSIIAMYEAPGGFSPAFLRFVRKMGNDNQAFAAAIINLGVKGYLSVSEEKKGLLGGRVYSLTKKDKSIKTDLSDEEKLLFETFFSSGDSIELNKANAITISTIRDNFYNSITTQVGTKYFAKNLVISVLGVIFSILTIAGSIIASVLLRFDVDSATPVMFKILLVIVLIFVNIIFVRLMRAYTKEGRKLVDEIEGFKLFLSVTEQDRLAFHNPPNQTPELFEKMLPYALALGVEHEWAQQFSSVFQGLENSGTTYSPIWYHGLGNSFSPDSFASTVGSTFSGVVSSASTPPGSSSGSSGGSSGGGGGGGGGGGW